MKKHVYVIVVDMSCWEEIQRNTVNSAAVAVAVLMANYERAI